MHEKALPSEVIAGGAPRHPQGPRSRSVLVPTGQPLNEEQQSQEKGGFPALPLVPQRARAQLTRSFQLGVVLSPFAPGGSLAGTGFGS